MKGYKVTEPDGTCRGFQYEVGKTYAQDGPPLVCKSGFHFCEKAVDCFNYYSFDKKNRVFEVETPEGARLDIDDDKAATDKITIIRELTWHEVLDLVNIGDRNSGKGNSGDRNSGNRNSGNRNSGGGNSGNGNSGSRNSGGWNSGNRNSGKGNSGDWNSGDWNSGDWNSGDRNSGVFNTTSPNLLMFNKPTDWTWGDWFNSQARRLSSAMNMTQWVSYDDMTDDERERYPDAVVMGGYLRYYEYHEACRSWWNGLSDEERQVFYDLPNYDPKVFSEITGIPAEELAGGFGGRA